MRRFNKRTEPLADAQRVRAVLVDRAPLRRDRDVIVPRLPLGISPPVAAWHIAPDTLTFEVYPCEDPAVFMPVHMLHLRDIADRRGASFSVVSEMIAGASGVGYYLVLMQYAVRSADMFAAIFVIAALGYGLNAIFLAAERRLIFWYAAAQ